MKKIFFLLLCLSALTVAAKAGDEISFYPEKDAWRYRTRVQPYNVKAEKCQAALKNLEAVPTESRADFLKDALAKYAPQDLKLNLENAKDNYMFIADIYDKYSQIAYMAERYLHKAANERPSACKEDDSDCLAATKCFEQAAEKYMQIYNRLNDLAAPYYGKERKAFLKKFKKEYKGLLLQNCGGINFNGTLQKPCVCDTGVIYQIKTDSYKVLKESPDAVLAGSLTGAPLYIKVNGKQKFAEPYTFVESDGGPVEIFAEGVNQKACVYKFIDSAKAAALTADFHFYPKFRQPSVSELCKVSKQWPDINCAK